MSGTTSTVCMLPAIGLRNSRRCLQLPLVDPHSTRKQTCTCTAVIISMIFDWCWHPFHAYAVQAMVLQPQSIAGNGKYTAKEPYWLQSKRTTFRKKQMQLSANKTVSRTAENQRLCSRLTASWRYINFGGCRQFSILLPSDVWLALELNSRLFENNSKTFWVFKNSRPFPDFQTRLEFKAGAGNMEHKKSKATNRKCSVCWTAKREALRHWLVAHRSTDATLTRHRPANLGRPRGQNLHRIYSFAAQNSAFSGN